jgi:hypothetical protein
MKKIIVTRRSDDYHACLENDSGVWGCGITVYSALGNLVLAHQAEFGLTVEEVPAKPSEPKEPKELTAADRRRAGWP